MNKKEFVAQLSKLRPNATFLTLLGYRNAHSEVADYSIAFHISYENALQKSIDILKEYNAKDIIEKQAKKELIDGYERSLIKFQTIPMEEIDDSYTRFFDGDRYIKGVKMLTKTGELHLYGLVVHKKVTMPGMYDGDDKRKELTKVKDRLRRLCPVSRFRQFKILPDQLNSISVEKLSLLPPNE
jgi:hypothetical protein